MKSEYSILPGGYLLLGRGSGVSL